MKLKRLGRWRFTPAELDWLADKALSNHLAADILYRYARRYGRKGR